MARKPVEFRKKNINYLFMFITILLILIGVFMVYSSSYNTSLLAGNSSTKELVNQLIGIAIGFVLMFMTSKFDYHLYRDHKFSFFFWMLLVSTVLLIWAKLSPATNNANRWARIPGVSFTFQSSEFTKVVLMLYVSVFLSERKWKKKVHLVKNESKLEQFTRRHPILVFLLPIALQLVLIVIEPDLSTCIVIAAAIIAVMIASDIPNYVWISLIVLGIVAAAALIILKQDYRSSRIDAWLNPWNYEKTKGYQVIQSLYAIGDGGLFGVGIGNSKQAITHLPMSESDYIFSIIAEEFGFIGAFAVILLFVAFAATGIYIAINAGDSLGTYIALSITLLITFQAMLNIAVTLNVAPSTGVTLPFISKGASSLMTMMPAVGIVLNVSSQRAVKRKH